MTMNTGANVPGLASESLDIEHLVEIARDLERRGELGEALARFTEALNALPMQPSTLRADVVRWIGTVRREMGDTAAAESLYRESLRVAQAASYLVGEAHAVNCLAIVTQRRGEVEHAATLYRRAARLAALGREHRLSGMIEQNLGVLANIRGDLDGALVRYRAALSAFETAGDKEGMSWVMNNIGMLQTDMKAFDEARLSLATGLAIAVERGDLRMEGLFQLNLAESYISEGRWDDADAPCERALEIASRRGDSLRRADALRFLAILSRERHDFAAARRYLDDALWMAREGEDTLLVAEILKETGTTRQREGSPKEARAAWQAAAGLFRSLDAALDAAAVEEQIAALPPSAANDGADRAPRGAS